MSLLASPLSLIFQPIQIRKSYQMETRNKETQFPYLSRKSFGPVSRLNPAIFRISYLRFDAMQNSLYILWKGIYILGRNKTKFPTRLSVLVMR